MGSSRTALTVAAVVIACCGFGSLATVLATREPENRAARIADDPPRQLTATSPPITATPSPRRSSVGPTRKPTGRKSPAPSRKPTRTPSRKPTTDRPDPKPVAAYSNCTELREDYPPGVPAGHRAYRKKMDRDGDGWACERD